MGGVEPSEGEKFTRNDGGLNSDIWILIIEEVF